MMLKKKLFDKGNRQAQYDVMQTLLKILDNLQKKPDDMKVRTLSKQKAAVKEKILAHDEVCEFLKLINFDFSGEEITLTAYH